MSFTKEITKLMEQVLLTFHVRYLEKMSEPEASSEPREEVEGEGEEGEGGGGGKKNYKYDHSRPFFTNLVGMIKFLKKHENLEKQRDAFLKQKNESGEMTENDQKSKYIQAIFQTFGQNLRPLNAGKVKPEEEMHYKPHLQTANSKALKVLAKPEFEENELNSELNNRLNNVKEMLDDSPAFKKLKQDEFYKVVRIFTSMDENASGMYEENWKSVGEDARPVFSRKEVITSCFDLMINHPDKISDS